MSNRPSPLFVWKAVLILIVAAGIFMYVSDPMKMVLNRRDDQLLKRVSRIHFNQDEIGIIFLGDSMLNCALPYRPVSLNNALAEECRKNGGLNAPISAVKLTWGVSAMKFRDIAGELIQARPSIVVIQGDMIVRRMLTNPPPPKITERVGTWSGILALQVFGRSQPRKAEETGQPAFTIKTNMPEVRRRTKKDETSLEETRQRWNNQAVNTADVAFVRAREFIDTISAKGIRVVVVELPVSNTAVAFSTKQYLAKRSAALDALSKEGVMHLMYPHVLSDRYFVDYSHVNPRGRREFLKWFLPLLSKELMKNERRS